MKVIMVASLVIGAFGTTPTTGYNYTGTYMRLGIVALKADAGDTNNGNAVNCNTGWKRFILVKTLPKYTTLDAKNGALNDLQGACVNFKAATILTDLFDNSVDKSFAVRHFTNDNLQYKVSANAAAGCSSSWVDQATGFTFASYATGQQACGMTLGQAELDGTRIEDSSANGITVQATLHVGKKNIPLTITGPFSDAGCTILNPNQFANYPLVIPLEASAAPAPFSEFALSTTGGVCTQWEKDAAADNAYSIMKAYVTSTTGALVIEMGIGAGSVWTNMGSCTAGTGSGEYKITYSMTATGNVDRCQQAYNHSDVIIATTFFKIDIHPEAAGVWASIPGIVAAAACPECAASPASGVHVSTLMTVAIALIAMMM